MNERCAFVHKRVGGSARFRGRLLQRFLFFHFSENKNGYLTLSLSPSGKLKGGGSLIAILINAPFTHLLVLSVNKSGIHWFYDFLDAFSAEIMILWINLNGIISNLAAQVSSDCCGIPSISEKWHFSSLDSEDHCGWRCLQHHGQIHQL